MKIWMKPPGGAPPEQVEYDHDTLVKLMVQGWTQCKDPVEASIEKMTGPKTEG